MKTVNVYKQYFKGECTYNGRDRHGVQVLFIAESDSGMITYSLSVSFFPHDTDDDYAVSYDAEKSVTLYQGKSRRSKKREAELMKELHETADSLAKELGGKIYWDKPLREAETA